MSFSDYHIEYIEDDYCLTRKFSGVLKIDEIINTWKYLIENKLKHKKYKGIINDFTNARLEMEIDDVEQLMNLFKENIDIFKDLKLAVIMSSPENIVFPAFAQNNSTFKIKPFSTISAAKDWMLL